MSWRLRLVIGVVAILLLASIVYLSPHIGKPNIVPVVNHQYIPLRPEFFDLTNFRQAIASTQKTNRQANIKAVIVPHHLLSSTYIAQALQSAQGRSIDQVIIIGPNHENTGSEAIATTNATWQGLNGETKSDDILVAKLQQDLQIDNQSEVLNHEHSVGAMIPFVNYYYPQARILPIAISSYFNATQLSELAFWLKNNCLEKCLIVYSIDFSHYLNRQQASAKDLVTTEVIKKLNVSATTKFNNDYVDSPGVLGLALQLARDQAWQPIIANHGNSADFLYREPEVTTSYFQVHFVK